MLKSKSQHLPHTTFDVEGDVILLKYLLILRFVQALHEANLLGGTKDEYNHRRVVLPEKLSVAFNAHLSGRSARIAIGYITTGKVFLYVCR